MYFWVGSMCNALHCIANYSNENIAQKYRQLSPLFCIHALLPLSAYTCAISNFRHVLHLHLNLNLFYWECAQFILHRKYQLTNTRQWCRSLMKSFVCSGMIFYCHLSSSQDKKKDRIALNAILSLKFSANKWLKMLRCYTSLLLVDYFVSAISSITPPIYHSVKSSHDCHAQGFANVSILIDLYVTGSHMWPKRCHRC